MVVPCRVLLQWLIDLTKCINSAQHFIHLYPITLCNLQGEAMINQRITYFTDDAALVDIIIRLFHFGLRLLLYLYVNWCLQCISLFRTQHISGFKSVSGNPLSLIQVSMLTQLALANVYSSPTVILDYHNITSIHVSKFNLSTLLISGC